MSQGTTSSTPLRTIGQIAEVLPGFSAGRAVKHDPTGSHQLIQSRDLTPGIPYRYRDEHAFRIDAGKRAQRFLLQPDDTLLMSRGTRNLATWLEEIPDQTLAASSYYVIRPEPGIHPGYLTWYLNQPTAQRRIAEIRTGAGAPIVQRAALKELEVPVPDIHTQVRLAELGVLMTREQELLAALTNHTGQLHDRTSEDLARRLAAGALSIRSIGQ